VISSSEENNDTPKIRLKEAKRYSLEAENQLTGFPIWHNNARAEPTKRGPKPPVSEIDLDKAVSGCTRVSGLAAQPALESAIALR